MLSYYFLNFSDLDQCVMTDDNFHDEEDSAAKKPPNDNWLNWRERSLSMNLPMLI